METTVTDSKTRFWAYTALLGASTIWGVNYPLRSDAPFPSHVSATGIIALLFVGAIATGVANFIGNWGQAQKENGQQIIGATHRALIENLDAPIAGVCEIIATSRGFGCALIIIGVLISELTLWNRFKPKRSLRRSQSCL